METKPLRGMLDLSPEDGDLWFRLLLDASRVLKDFGYSFVRTPVVERKELFVRGLGEGTDIVVKEMYEFKDRKGKDLVLRPEETASIVRMVIDQNLLMGRSYLKVFTFGPMFRYERPQRGRYREFYQIDVEFIGIKDPSVEVESLVILNRILMGWGLEGLYSFGINHLGCAKDRELYKEKLRGFLEGRDLCEDCKERMRRNVLRVLDCKRESCREALKEAPTISDFLCEECKGYFNQVKGMLKKFDIPFDEDPGLVRGLDYYTGFVFEVFFEGFGAQNAFAGGGRYDGLFKEMGGKDVPAFGFGIGIDRAFGFIKERLGFKKPPMVFFCPLDGVSREKLLEIKWALAGSNSFIFDGGYQIKSLKSQLKQADRLGAKLVVIMGENERKEGVVLIRDMETGRQEKVPFENVGEAILNWPLEG